MGSVGQIICLAAIAGYNLRAIDVINTRGTIAYIGPGCNAGSFESFTKLKEALQTIHEGHRIP